MTFEQIRAALLSRPRDAVALTVSGWPASMKWNANTAPVFSAAANDVSSITVQYDGTNWWQIGGLTAYQ